MVQFVTGEGKISIHALREEGDSARLPEFCFRQDFYPRPPRGGRPSRDVDGQCVIGISIHALREEGDLRWQPGGLRQANFYPRPPRGGRRWRWRKTASKNDFYPRPPRGGRHAIPPPCAMGEAISIHALREEGDLFKFRKKLQMTSHFYPRPPRGGRRCQQKVG